MMNEENKIKLKLTDWLMLAFSLVGTCLFGYLLYYPEPVIRYFIHTDSTGTEIGVVESASNDVRRRLHKSLTWYEVRSSEVIFENDTVFTGPNSEIFIQLDDDIGFRLGENSLVVLSQQNGTFELDLQVGSVVADVKGDKALKLKGRDEDATIYGSGVESKVSINKNKEGKLSLASLDKQFEFEVGGEKSVVEAKKALKLNENFDEDRSRKAVELIHPPLGHLMWHRVNEDFKFEWDNPKDFENLKLQVSKKEDFSKITYEKEVTGRVHRVPGVRKEAKYFWRVVQHRDGETKQLSEVHNFQLAILRAPEMILPKNNEVLQAGMSEQGYLLALTQFQWESRLGVEKYHIQVSPDKDFSNIIINEETSEVSKSLVELPPGPYYWRVRVSAPVQASGAWPEPHFFTVSTPEEAKAIIAERRERKLQEQRLDRGLPNVPAFRALDPGVLGSQIIEKSVPLVAPPAAEPEKMVLLQFDPKLKSREPAAINRAIVNPPVLKWKPTPGATEYEVEIADDSAFESIRENIRTKETNFTWKDPEIGGYFWRVRSGRGLGQFSDYSDANKLAVGLESPKLPPKIEREFQASNPKEYMQAGPPVALQWKRLPKAQKYKLVVMDGKSMTKVFEQDTDSNAVDVLLPKSGNYKAMVAALNEQGKRVSPFSEPSNVAFTKKLKFDKPRISYPVNGTTVVSFGASKTNSMILDWTKVKGAKSYRLQFSKTKDFRAVFLDKTVNKDQYFVNDEFPPGTIYWRVRAEYDSLDSGWSPARYFEIQSVKQ